ncbi:MAG: LTA synthase family protein [Proteobacteria bacterium]|nr:LTA synthase family protein [Pseudomonadota bacterium]
MTALEKSPPRKTEINKTGSPVVILLLESFVDPLDFRIRFDRDPIPNFREFAKRHGLFYAQVPGFGGSTENTTFELLTGAPIYHLPKDTKPNVHYIRRPLDSIVRSFQSSGYRSIGLHNFHGWAWRRNLVWPWLGFESIQFGPDFEQVALNEQDWPTSDKPLFDAIERELLKPDILPPFIYAVSVATHGPYRSRSGNQQERVQVLDSPAELQVTDWHIDRLEDYVSRLSVLDRELKPLFEAIERSGARFLILGDHHPSPSLSFTHHLGPPGTPKFQSTEPRLHLTPAIVDRMTHRRWARKDPFPGHCVGLEFSSALGISLSRLQTIFHKRCSFEREVASSKHSKEEKNLVYDLLFSELGLEPK